MNCRNLLLGAALWLACGVFNTVAAQSAVTIPEDYAAREVKADFVANGPRLLFSDSPEMVYQTGILYRDKVQGAVRIFFHHVNAMNSPKKLALLLRNEDQLRPVAYTVKRRGVSQPDYNYMNAGKKAELDYFTEEQRQEGGRLGFGSSCELLGGSGVVLSPDEIVTGMIDLELTRPAQISVLLCEPQTDLEIFNDSAAILPMDEHPLRGSFAGGDWHYTLKNPVQRDGTPYKLKLAGADAGYAKGVDATTGLAAENYGNYGVVYQVNFTVAGDKPVSLVLNPIGGAFAGYGVLQSEKGRRLLALPDYALCFGERLEDAVDLGRLKPGNYSFIWSPPGASNLPVELIWR
ncbi:MAG: copper amine oxidase [Phascolarctobacterium sp.]|uniref:copper amine oxidase n=1 Tax=Phascolarctobacterium sp. TaxID=2049039 RepID=UPI0026DA8FF8|nr:copper amine oxidase [Phascolarctobacterium sp.]MDO4922103.1 copper amine oxidase [Phascolarctobacterium sp.]